MDQNVIKNQEVELRVLLDQIERNEFVSNIKIIGAEYVSTLKLKDVYYCPKSVQKFEEVEMDEVGSFSLRLRQKMVNNTEKTELNIKMITTHGDHHAWEEHESEVRSFDEIDCIIKILGYKAFFELVKTRVTYKFERIEIALEDIEDFGAALELEIMSDKEGIDAAKQELKNFLKSINVSPEKIVPKSVTNILMKQKAKF